MSEENVELVRRIYEAWRQEKSARDFIAEDIEYVNPSYAVEPGTRRGRKSFRVIRDTYEDFQIQVERYVDAGEEVVVLARRDLVARAQQNRDLIGDRGGFSG